VAVGGVRRPASLRTDEQASSPSTLPSSIGPPSGPSTIPAARTTAAAGDVFDGARDMRVRVGATALSGPTTTALPKLLDDWRGALLQAAAEGRADEEVIAPALGPALQQAEQQKGEPLSRREARGVERAVRQQLQQPWDDAYRVHLADVTKTPKMKQRVERDVVMAERPRIAALKDPFTPVVQNAPGARDNEIVLWENKHAVVVVDTFAPSPKALVVPRVPASLPLDLPRARLDELARVAAQVSDAFMRAAGSPAAGIWVNPPQHLTVKQLHVHVLPDVADYTADRAPAKALLDDAALRPQLLAWFGAVQHELAATLGPPSA
jgi:diadenosine tetraphosphate (Ap4A) HIT family hydrolase